MCKVECSDLVLVSILIDTNLPLQLLTELVRQSAYDEDESMLNMLKHLIKTGVTHVVYIVFGPKHLYLTRELQSLIPDSNFIINKDGCRMYGAQQKLLRKSLSMV
jgi:hypothetical protein